MALLERLEEHFELLSSFGESVNSTDSVGFLLNLESFTRFVDDPEWREDIVRNSRPHSRIIGITNSTSQWFEIRTIEDVTSENMETLVGVFVGNASRVTTVLAEIHGDELYGAERAHLELIEHLVPDGYFFRTIGPSMSSRMGQHLLRAGSGVWEIEERDQLKRSIKAGPLNALGSKDRQRIAEKPPDILLAHTVLARFLPTLAQILDIPLVWWLHEFGDRDHGFQFLPSRSSFVAWVRKTARRIVVNSESVKHHFFGDALGDISVVGYATATPPRGLSVGLPTKLLRGGVVARLESGKGQEIAIEALKELRGRGYETSLSLFGSGTAREIVRLKKVVQQADLEKEVQFHGFVGDLNALYRSLDFVVVASADEALGRVPMEAGLRGVPVFFHARGHYPHQLLDEVTGIEFAADDPKDLAEKIIEWSGRQEDRSRLLTTAREWWEDQANTAAYRRTWSEIFQGIR